MLPSASIEADASKLTLSGAAPVLGAAVNEAMGGALATVTVRVVESVRPESSVTVSVAIHVPAGYTRVAEGPEAVPPSPKSHT